jgi:hypothetical protein
MIVIAILLILLGLATLAFVYRDTLAEWLPGLKHALAGWPVALTGGALTVLQYIQGQEASVSIVFAKHPEYPPLIMTGLGLAILVLSWITPRKDA